MANRAKELDNFQDRAEEREYKKGYNAGKNKRNRGKRGSRGQRSNSGTYPGNDPTDYTPNDQLLRDVASFGFGTSNGFPIDFGGLGYNYLNTPGILRIPVFPLFGPELTGTDGFNVAMNALFIAMQRKSGRNPQYDYPDLGKIVLSVADIYARIAFATTVYGVANSEFSLLNKYEPQAVILSLGFDPNEIRTNMANIRTTINTLIYNANSIYIPKDIKYVANRMRLFEHVYKDAESDKAQLIVFVNACVARYHHSTKVGGVVTPSTVSFENVGFHKLPAQNPDATFMGIGCKSFLKYLQAIMKDLQGLLVEEDATRIISADLLNAFGVEGKFSLTPLPENYTIKPIYNQDVLMQLENATIHPDQTMNFTISENPAIDAGYLNYKSFSVVRSSGVKPSSELIGKVLWTNSYTNAVSLNVHFPNPDPGKVMDMTRYITSEFRDEVVSTAGSGETQHLVSTFSKPPATCGITCLFGAQIIYFLSLKSSNYQPTLTYAPFQTMNLITPEFDMSEDTTTAELLKGLLLQLSLANSFDWTPRQTFQVLTQSLSTGAMEFSNTYVGLDLDNYTLATWAEIDKMNNVAMYGLFVPRTGEVASLFSN